MLSGTLTLADKLGVGRGGIPSIHELRAGMAWTELLDIGSFLPLLPFVQWCSTSLLGLGMGV